MFILCFVYMLFQTCEHYDLNNTPDCMVCFDNTYTTIRLCNQTYYTRICECDGWIHPHCLTKWIRVTNRCPICRANVQRKVKKDFNIMKYFHCFCIFLFNPMYLLFQLLTILYFVLLSY